MNLYTTNCKWLINTKSTIVFHKLKQYIVNQEICAFKPIEGRQMQLQEIDNHKQ